MSGVTYRYEQSYSFVKKGVKNTVKENVIDGDKGLSVMFLEKKGEDFYKMYVKEIEKNKFELVEKKGEEEQPKEIINEKDLLKMLKTHKLETIINYISKERGTYKGLKNTEDVLGGATKAKKSSKKGTKKGTKNKTKKISKKKSKETIN